MYDLVYVLGTAQQVIFYIYIYICLNIYAHTCYCTDYFVTLGAVRELVNFGLLQMEINFIKINSNFVCAEYFHFKMQELVGR